eukprot:gene30429-39212_t
METPMSYETILVETRGPVTLITLNRPQSLNALNSMVLGDLIAAFAAFEGDPSQRCAVLTGAGEKAFAAGADIKEMADKPAADFYALDFFARWTSHLVKTTRKPWIAAVNGFALGGGCELAMMADFIIASDNAKFGQPEVKLGVAPGMGGSQRLTRAIGKAKAMEMCLTGRMMDAAEAERSGLVARVVPLADLMADALRTAEAIAAMPPLAAIANKEMVNAAFETTLDQGLLFERRLFQVLTGTHDRAEGMAAFIEKRPGGSSHKGRYHSEQKDHDMAKRIAFIGLGNMGGGMAANLVAKGFKVEAYDLDPAALGRAKLAGCGTHTSINAALDGVDAVVT